MVDVKTETKPQTKPVNPRDAIREQRQRRLRVIKGEAAATVKVFAANETLREVLRHPGNGVRFRDDGSAVWPNDSFTKRRIADGSVRTDGPGSGEPAEPDESLNPRQQAAANKPKPKDEHSKDAPKNGSKSPKPQHEPEHHPAT
jgi:hypothetical protein